MTVVLDTNALMMPVECNVRVFDELDRLLDGPACLTAQSVVTELEKLADGAGEEAKAASVGYDLATDRCEIRSTDADYADDAVLELAVDEGAHLLTNDKPLVDRAHEAGVSVISLRGKNKLGITQ
ncbi:PIN domain-containing protein [Halovenus sp. HT40]|uniref:PIN domain-containing protein n=1 Tax=Halovenus sp. HT40 TaxID=3126691 RepID=UPI00300ED87A